MPQEPVNTMDEAQNDIVETTSEEMTNTTQDAEAVAAMDAADLDVPEVAEAAAENAEDDNSYEGASSEVDDDEDAVGEPPVDDGVQRRFRRGDVVAGKISKTSPTEVTVDLGEGSEGIITSRELERMSRKNLDELQIGEEVTVFVVNPHDHRGNVILSINRALEEIDWKQAEEFRAEQRVYNDIVAGYNKGGLIVRFGRLRGFVPQSQISDERRRQMQGSTPEERYGAMVNDDIVVKVMEVDRSRNRLILSERAATRERREARKAALIEELEVGQITEGRVVSLEDFGAFVDVGGAEGLVHLTEISWKHVTHPKEALRIGQTVKVEVISIDRDRKRIGLSIKRQLADPWDEVATTYQVGDLVQATVTKLTKFGAFARLVDAEDIEGLIHISELSEQRVNHPRDVVKEGEKMTLRVVKIDVKNRRLGLSLKRVNSSEYLDHDLNR
ncbi:MAG: 30S ribosomal protein S1 [Anaerolineae bacterium]